MQLMPALATARESTTPAADEVRVFWTDLDIGADAAWPLADMLDAHERKRAARFHFRSDAIRYVVGRARLRTLLGGVLGEKPAALTFAYGVRGKPELSGRFAASCLRFNVSHSDGLSVIALVWGRRIGVDVERVRRLADLEAIAERTYSPRERADLQRLPPNERQLAFFRCWTRKESFIKALGEGLSCPLDRFSVTLRPDEPARLVESDVDAAAAVWTLESLETPRGFVGALAFEGPPLRITGGRWETI